jgi:hypothetical protein
MMSENFFSQKQQKKLRAINENNQQQHLRCECFFFEPEKFRKTEKPEESLFALKNE